VGIGLDSKTATVNASGDAGGGTILIGGNFQGKGPEQNAVRTIVGQEAVIRADAVTTGNGGKVIVWSDVGTAFSGSVTARGGAQSGDGGFVEISGKHLDFLPRLVDTRAPHGVTGTLLLDPVDLSSWTAQASSLPAPSLRERSMTARRGASSARARSIRCSRPPTSPSRRRTASRSRNTSAGNITNTGNGRSLAFRVTTGSGGINTDDAAATHGSITVTGGSATLTMDAGTGGIDLWDAPGQGGTNFVAQNVSLLAQGNIVVGSGQANGNFVARSTGGNVQAGTDGYIRGDTLIDLRAAGHISKTDLTKLDVDTTGTLRLNNADFNNSGAPGSEKVIRAKGLATTATTLDIDVTASANGLSIVDVQGQGGTQLLLHSGGTLSGTGLSGAGKSVDFASGGTANYLVNGLTAGKITLSAGGTVSLANATANGTGAAGDLTVTAEASRSTTARSARRIPFRLPQPLETLPAPKPAEIP